MRREPFGRARLGVLAAVVATAIAACGGSGDHGAQAGPVVPHGEPPAKHAPANAVGGFSIELPPMQLPPGDEQTPCWIFPLDVTGPSHIVGGGALTTGPGMHHGNITTRPATGTGIRPCPTNDGASVVGGEGVDILNGGAVLFASSTQISGTEWQSLPDGEGYRVKDGFEIVARMHYLNVTGDTLTIAPKYEWYTIDESTLVHEVGPFAWAYNDIHIPPKATVTLGASCRFPSPMHIVYLLPHMHKLGTAFDAGFVGGALDGQPFLESAGYDPQNGVIEQYDPAVDLSQGDGASFACTWKNTYDKEIVEGIGDNEMCILFGYAWPPANAFSAVGSTAGCVYAAPP
jgi:hypothetical protein